VKFWAI